MVGPDVPDVDTLAEIGYRTTREVFAKDPAVSALFYLSDYYAMGGLAFLTESGRIPGKDVLIGGYNNIHAVRTCLFPVSSAEHPTAKHAEALLEGLKQNGPFSQTLYAEAIIREQVKFLSGQ